MYDRTTPERIEHLRTQNYRLRRFLRGVSSHGWTVEGSNVVVDCIIVRHPVRADHFVLYPIGTGRNAALRVYDGRDGHEFSPLPARDARCWIATSTRTD